MILDSVIVIFAILAFYRGWKKGIVSALLSFVAVLLGVILSLKLSHTLANYLTTQNIINTKYMLPIACIVIFIATLFVMRLAIKAIEGVLKLAMLGWANKLVGATLYAGISLFILSVVFWLGNFVNVIAAQSKSESISYAFVEPFAPKCINFISNYIPYCKNLLDSISQKTI